MLNRIGCVMTNITGTQINKGITQIEYVVLQHFSLSYVYGNLCNIPNMSSEYYEIADGYII